MHVDFEKLRMSGAGKAIAVLTSGGDAQGKQHHHHKSVMDKHSGQRAFRTRECASHTLFNFSSSGYKQCVNIETCLTVVEESTRANTETPALHAILMQKVYFVSFPDFLSSFCVK